MSNTINSYYSSSLAASSRKGISGLVSGMDTDSIIENMLKSYNSKLSGLYQKRDKLGWKTTAYQSVSTSLLDFQSKYLSSSSSSSVFNSKFFNNSTITSQGSNAGAITVTGGVNDVKNLQIGSISQLAAIASLTTGVYSSEHAISTDYAFSTSADGTTLTNGSIHSQFEGQSITLTVDGVRHALTLSDIKVSSTTSTPDLAGDAQNVIDAMNASIKKAGLSDKVQASLSDRGKVEIKAISNDAGTVKIEGASSTLLEKFGMEVGASTSLGEAAISGTKILTTQTTYESATLQSMANKSITFDLDGIKRTITFDDTYTNNTNHPGVLFEDIKTAGDLQKYLNAKMQDAYGGKNGTGGKVSVQDDGGKMKFVTKDTTAILSIASGSGEDSVLGGKSFLGLDLGDANRLLRFDSIVNSNTTLDQATRESLKAGGSQDIVLNGITFSVFQDKIDVKAPGAAAKTYKFDNGTSVADIMNTINNSDAGVTMKYNSTSDRLNIVANESGSLGKIEFSFDSDPAKNALTRALFGNKNQVEGVAVGTGAEGNATITKGQDAKMSVSLDGGNTFQDITRNSNSFELDGMGITLNKTFTSGDKVTFTGKNNVDDTIKNIKEMVDAYNKIIKDVNNQLNTRPDKNYPPLTAEQRKELSEDEIKAYEEKAKQGLLFADSTLRGLATDFRFTCTLPIGDDSLSQIGISVPDYTSDSTGAKQGLLKVDENKLRQVLESDPDRVQRLFTAGTSSGSTASEDAGAMTRMNAVMNKYVATSGIYENRGMLIQRAGHESSPLSLSDSTMSKEAVEINKQITSLIDKIKTKQESYYKQFSNLEVYLSQMNAQSSWLTQQFGGGQ